MDIPDFADFLETLDFSRLQPPETALTRERLYQIPRPLTDENLLAFISASSAAARKDAMDYTLRLLQEYHRWLSAQL